MRKEHYNPSLSLSIDSWYAWAPSVESCDAWRAWACGKEPIKDNGVPEVSFIPPNIRRRCSMLTKIALKVAYEACTPDELQEVRTIFASRYGEMSTTISLLHELTRGEELSPTHFSLSVHNTASGQLSILAKNKEPSVSIAAGRETFCYGLLESAQILIDTKVPKVLLVYVEEPLPSLCESFIDELQSPIGIALLLSLSESRYTFTIERSEGVTEEKLHYAPTPQWQRFLRWLFYDERTVVIPGEGTSSWVMQKRSFWTI